MDLSLMYLFSPVKAKESANFPAAMDPLIADIKGDCFMCDLLNAARCELGLIE